MTFNVRSSGVNPNIGLAPEADTFIYKKVLTLCLDFEKVSILLISPNNLNRYFIEKSAGFSPHALFLV